MSPCRAPDKETRRLWDGRCICPSPLWCFVQPCLTVSAPSPPQPIDLLDRSGKRFQKWACHLLLFAERHPSALEGITASICSLIRKTCMGPRAAESLCYQAAETPGDWWLLTFDARKSRRHSAITSLGPQIIRWRVVWDLKSRAAGTLKDIQFFTFSFSSV